jgi:parvulin-like peptidyl-prolyl isomerase
VPTEEIAAETRHILCSFNPDDPSNPTDPAPEQRAAAETCIRQAQMRLADGEDFAAVAAALSDDATSAAQGGDVGAVLLSYMAESYAQAVESAALGKVVGPVETSFGLHLIEVQSRAPRALTADELAEAQRGYFELWLQSLHDEAAVTRRETWAEGVSAGPGLESLDPVVQSAVQAVLAGD